MDFVAGFNRDYRLGVFERLLFVMARASRRLVICLGNSGYEVALERRKIYVALLDAAAARHGRIRVVDESDDDNLYPAERFVEADLPLATRRAAMRAV